MKKSNLFIILFLFLLAICTALMLFEIALGLLAIFALVILATLSFQDGSIQARLLSITYVFGSVLCWIIGFLGCLYSGFDIAKYPIITMILINLVTWGGLAGSLLALPFQNKINKLPTFTNIPEKFKNKAFKVTGVIFIIFLLVGYASGSFNARYEVGSSLPVGSPLYFIQGLSVLQPLVFLFAGMRLSPPLLTRRNIALILVPLLGGLVFSLAGGREASLRIIILFLLGTLYSKIDLKQIKLLALASLPLVLVIIIVIGYARSSTEFGYADLGTRMQLIYQVATEGAKESGTEYDNPWYGLLTRITEPSGQLVIDNVFETKEFIGFENLDRTAMLVLPKIIFPGEKLFDDSSERLEKYGIIATQFTAAPITLMADSFERGGYLAVFIISLIVSLCLTWIGYLINRNKNYLFNMTLLVSLALNGMRIYSMSVLGVINFLTYGLARDAILIWLLFRVIGSAKDKSDKCQIVQ